MGIAKALDYNVYVTDINPDAPGIKWVRKHGKGWGIASTYDAQETISVISSALKQKIDGVVAVACDVGPTVSLVAKELGLSHLPHCLTSLSWDKRLLKSYLSPQGIPIPGGPSETDEYYVIKPIESRGSAGVYRVKSRKTNAGFVVNNTELIEKSRKFSTSSKIIVERWISGPQISAETIVWKNKVLITCMSDRNYDHLENFAPNVIENGGEAPSIYEKTAKGKEIKRLTQRVVDALGIESGTFKSDIVLDADDGLSPVFIEAHIGRMGPSVTHHWPAAYNINFLGAAFAIACGNEPFEYLKQKRKPMYTCGRYELPGHPKNSNESGKFFFAIADSREEAIKKAEKKKSDYVKMCSVRA